MIEAPSLARLDGVDHRFFTRRGGVSEGLYSSLNCGYGSGDSPDNVRENRRRAAGTFSAGETDLLTLYQIHSADVLTIAVMSLVLSLLATIYPSWRASRVNPAEALRYE